VNRVVADLVRGITPLDALERLQIDETLEWIGSGAVLFRLEKPATPPKHLVAYFVVIDPEARAVLLVHHRQAQRWLPSGGHVEPDEHPTNTVIREALEELRFEATFLFDQPFFLSVSKTVGTTVRHTDVSLWYVLRAENERVFEFDAEEFLEVRWVRFQDVSNLPTEAHLSRFLEKFQRRWGNYASSSSSSFGGGA
jgi:8-oxo-dGTP diphosphatase